MNINSSIDIKENKRFKIESWVCDWGIFDNETNSFLGNPIESYIEAERILLYLDMVEFKTTMKTDF